MTNPIDVEPVDGETVAYPPCERGIYSENYAHDFWDSHNESSAELLMYCRRCGLVQKIKEARP